MVRIAGKSADDAAWDVGRDADGCAARRPGGRCAPVAEPERGDWLQSASALYNDKDIAFQDRPGTIPSRIPPTIPRQGVQPQGNSQSWVRTILMSKPDTVWCRVSWKVFRDAIALAIPRQSRRKARASRIFIRGSSVLNPVQLWHWRADQAEGTGKRATSIEGYRAGLAASADQGAARRWPAAGHLEKRCGLRAAGPTGYESGR